MKHNSIIQEDQHKKPACLIFRSNSKSNQSASNSSLARTFFTSSEMKGSAWSMSSLTTALPDFHSQTCHHSHSHSECSNEFSTQRDQFETQSFAGMARFDNNCSNCFSEIDEWLEHANNFCNPSNLEINNLTECVYSRRNGCDEDSRISAVCHGLMVPEQELYNITLPSVREESSAFQGHTHRLSCIYGASRYGGNEGRGLIRRSQFHDEFLDQLRMKKQEAKREARRRAKHDELMERMRRKEDAINDWELQQTRKAMDEMDKLQNELERKQLMASTRAQKKICMLLMDPATCVDVCDKHNGIFLGDDEVPKQLLPECVVPITPDTIKENGDFPIDLRSPLTLVEGGTNDSDSNDSGNGNCSPHTPKDAVFDPFAPGPDINMPRAPNHKKYLDQSRLTVVRQLNFDPHVSIQHHDDADDAESLSDEDMVELMYKSLLQVIVSKQTEEAVLAAAAAQISYDADDCKTPPPSFPLVLLEEQLHTCPGAPMKVKPGDKRRNNIQLGSCKKLEF
ncbi:hypothetical protein RIF29_18229 [Crotalaria pallida]|uniref:Uncharacterized protein n=1 Tax=Crotalaria pallida TaxID=3830 RepID=A0AAN9FIP0_CROPI